MKASKQALAKWQEHCKKVQQHTVVDAFETEVGKRLRIEKAKNDYQFFLMILTSFVSVFS